MKWSWPRCEGSGKALKPRHGDATLGLRGYCSVCGYSYTATAKGSAPAHKDYRVNQRD